MLFMLHCAVQGTLRNLIIIIAPMHYQNKSRIYVQISYVQISTINIEHSVP